MEWSENLMPSEMKHSQPATNKWMHLENTRLARLATTILKATNNIEGKLYVKI